MVTSAAGSFALETVKHMASEQREERTISYEVTVLRLIKVLSLRILTHATTTAAAAMPSATRLEKG